MTLRNGEYEIKDDKIIIPKKVLEKLRDHYKAEEQDCDGTLSWFYLGKCDVYLDLLKMFEPLCV